MKYVSVQLIRSETESVQRDMPPWEVAVLQMVHGPEKVKVVGEKDVPDQDYPDAYQEFDRLSQRYGADTKSDVYFVAAVYGQPPFGVTKLAEEIERAKKADKVPRRATASTAQSVAAIDE